MTELLVEMPSKSGSKKAFLWRLALNTIGNYGSDELTEDIMTCSEMIDGMEEHYNAKEVTDEVLESIRRDIKRLVKKRVKKYAD